MWETIIGIILKYWVEFLLGAVVAGGTFFLKRYLKLEREDRERKQKEFYDNLTDSMRAEYKSAMSKLLSQDENIVKDMEKRCNKIKDEFRADDACLQKQIDNVSIEMSAIRAGLLSIQGKEFRESCRRLLAENHTITLDEWEEIDSDHDAYNGLGGNHRGDALYSMVKKKAESTLTD